MKNTIRFLFALAPAIAAAQQPAPLDEVTRQLGPLDGAVYFEAGAVDRPGDGVARWFTRLADLLEDAAAGDPLPVDTDFLEALRKVPLPLDFAGANSVRAFGRVVRPDGDGAFRHRSFWAGGEGNRAWDLLAAEAPAPADCIPASAILAFASSADPRALWELAREALAEADPDTLASFDKALAAVRAGMGIDVTNLVANLRPGVFWAATADPAKPVEFDGIGVPLPSPGFVYGVGCETRDLLATAATLMTGMGFRIQFEEKGPDGSEGFVVLLPDEAADELPFEFLATVRWSPAKKMIVFASTQALACNALEDVAAPKLVDAPAFKKHAAGLPEDGSLRWVSPEFVKLAATVFANSDGVPDGFKALFADPADFWYVARSRRLPGGLLSESRSTLPSPANVRAMQDAFGGVAALGVVTGLLVPAVRSTTSSAHAVKTANAGRNAGRRVRHAVVLPGRHRGRARHHAVPVVRQPRRHRRNAPGFAGRSGGPPQLVVERPRGRPRRHRPQGRRDPGREEGTGVRPRLLRRPAAAPPGEPRGSLAGTLGLVATVGTRPRRIRRGRLAEPYLPKSGPTERHRSGSSNRRAVRSAQ